MSSKVETVAEPIKKVSKKRKHVEDLKEPKKKRKQSDETIEFDSAEQQQPKSKDTEKKKRKGRERHEGTGDSQTGSTVDVNGTAAPVSTPQKEKKKKKRQKEVVEESAEGQPPDTTADDVELPDAPSLEEEEKTAVNMGDPTAAQDEMAENTFDDQIQSDTPSSFRSVRMSLYLPTPPIGLDKALAATLALHVTPLLLTYFPPVGGVILSIHDPVLSATPQATLNLPLLPPQNGSVATDSLHVFPRVGDEFGACWAWLTVTFLVYSPQPGDELQGWTNAMSEGFIGLVCYNYFQTSIAKSRIPKAWTWDGPSRAPRQRKTPRKGKLNDGDGPSQESQFDSQDTIVVREDDAIDGTAGNFLDENGIRISDTLKFRVVDLEMIPAQERGQLALQAEGTLLNKDEEALIRQEERQKFETRMGKLRARSRTPGTPMMSGGLATHSRAGSAIPTP